MISYKGLVLTRSEILRFYSWVQIIYIVEKLFHKSGPGQLEKLTHEIAPTIVSVVLVGTCYQPRTKPNT